MSENVKHDSEPPKIEKSPFPISEASVKKTLESIAENPTKRYRESSLDIQSNNPGVAILIRELVDIRSNNGSDPMDVISGCIWAYELIKDSVEGKGGHMPILVEEELAAYSQNRKGEKMGKSASDFITRRMEEIRKVEPAFIKAIEDIYKYSIRPDFSYLGATEIYIAVKQADSNSNFTTMMEGMGVDLKG